MSIFYRISALFISLIICSKSFASDSCIESDYKPQTISAIDCNQKVCFATLACGTTRTNKKPLVQLDFIPSTIQKKIFACLADANGNCPSSSEECENKKVKDSLIVTSAANQISKSVPSKSDSYGNTYQYETLAVVSLGKSGGCNKNFCIGSLSIYEIDSSPEPYATNFPVGCLQSASGKCPNETACTHDKKFVIFSPKDTAVHRGDVSSRDPASNAL